MVAIQRMRIQWVGFPGGPGVTTLFAVDAAGMQGDVQSLFEAFAVQFPPDVTVKQETFGDTIESTTGILTGGWIGTDHPAIVGSGGSNYAAPVGAQVQWLTDGIHAGHRVKGRTFIVPISSNLYQDNGSLIDSLVLFLATAGGDFVTATADNFKIWSRPRDATPSWTDVHGKVHPARPAVDGSATSVSGVKVPDKAVILRSRRD